MTRAMQEVSTGIARAGYDGYELIWRTRKDKDEVRDTRTKETREEMRAWSIGERWRARMG